MHWNLKTYASLFVLTLIWMTAGPIDPVRGHGGHGFDVNASTDGEGEAAEKSDDAESGDQTEAALPDGAVTLDDPILVIFQRQLETGAVVRTRGKLLAHHASGFQFDPGDGAKWMPWDEVVAKDHYLINFRLHREADASKWVEIGVALSDKAGGEKYSELAFNRARKLNPEIDAAIDAALAEADAEPEPKPTADESSDAGPKAGKEGGKPVKKAEGGAMHGPRMVGEIDKSTWGDMTAEARAKAIERHKAWSEKAIGKSGTTLGLLETKYFLFYTDLTTKEAKQWGSLLDRMHERLLKMFGLPRGKNIWHGKGCIYVFKNEKNYHQFLRANFGIASFGSAGICISHGSGDVHIAFFRQPDKWAFAGVLVHEAVHGFIHRYRSPARIASWINEGLAEIISQQLVPQYDWVDRKRRGAREMLRRSGHFGGMFRLGHIAGHHYGMAADLVDFMVSQDRKRFVRFFNGIKDGLTWQESLEKNYAPLDKVVQGYGASISAKDLKP